MTNDLDKFLKLNNLTAADFESANIPWQVLNDIAQDHNNRKFELNSIAEFCAKTIQSFPKVHSIRWRIKNSDHLKAKIIRKKSENSEKYKTIDVENYKEIITDLVGIRILHLFKDDYHPILENLKKKWVQTEEPIAYIRKGDSTESFEEKNIKTLEHKAGYRSVHYLFQSSPTHEKIIVETQIRTIFEEGWSEIDHNLRYPNYKPNFQTEYFLQIFNRLAGSADEMGDFANKLERLLKLQEIQNIKANEKIESLLSTLENSEKNNFVNKEIIEKLRNELSNVKDSSRPTQYIKIGENNSDLDLDELKAKLQKIRHSININNKKNR